MTVTRRGSARRLRLVVLVAALIAPAILAMGMLLADFAGYGDRALGARDVRAEPGAGRAAGTAGSRALAAPAGPAVPPDRNAPGSGRGTVVPMAGAATEPVLDPTPVPEPSGPARLYKGLVRILPIPVRVPRIVHNDVPKVRRPAVEKPEPREEAPFKCAPEWRDTWLWELCRERESQSQSEQ